MSKRPATFVLVGINVLVFVVMAIVQGSILFDKPGDFLAMLRGGANFNPYTIRGEYWRLFSSMFMHWGIIHVAVNMFAFYNLARILEDAFGSFFIFMLYLFTGICAGIASLYFNVYVVSAGASGAIFGLYGYAIVRQVLVNFRDRNVLTNVVVNFVIFVAINYFIAKGVAVDTAAHIGGFVSGALLCVAQYFRMLTSRVSFAILTFGCVLLVFTVPKGQLNYYNVFQDVLRTDQRMHLGSRLPLSDRETVDSLRNWIVTWDSLRTRLHKVGSIPEELNSDTSIIQQYIGWRRDLVNYRLQMIERESYVFLDSIEITNGKLDTLPRLRYYVGYDVSGIEYEEEQDTLPASSPLEVITVWYDSGWRETTFMTEARYYRVGTKDSLGRWQGDVRDHFISGNIQMKGTYKNDLHDGVFIYYSDHNTYEALGRYVDDRPVGRWEQYHSNGILKEEVFYNNGVYVANTWDSLGRPQVQNGNGRSTTWHKNGQVAEEGSYVNGAKEDYWYGFYPSGAPHYQEMYRDNRLIRGVAKDEKGQRYVYDQLSVFPYPTIGMTAFQEYLRKNFVRSPEMGEAHGEVKINFTVDANGDCFDFVVTQSVCTPCDQEAIRLVKEGPAWRPGLERGHKKIRSEMWVTVPF